MEIFWDLRHGIHDDTLLRFRQCDVFAIFVASVFGFVSLLRVIVLVGLLGFLLCRRVGRGELS